MDKARIIEIKQNVFKSNEIDANNLRKTLKEKKTFLLNLMSSPGSGKTTLLVQLLKRLTKQFKVAVMEADIDSDVDANKILEETNAHAIQLHTGGMCHLDAGMTKQGLDELKEHYDLIIIENVGNLVCPAEFDTGAHKNMMILSVPEGDDKPLKYPLMFQVTDLVVINKIDVLPYFNFSLDKVEKNVHMRNPNTKIIKVSALKDENIDELADYLSIEINKVIKE